jgi:hypothetical protein
MCTGGAVFYDLGSGTGKVVLAAALLHDFSTCCGIELLSGLHSVARTYKQSWDDSKALSMSTCTSTSTSTSINVAAPALRYIQGSILDITVGNWPQDGDVVFANTHCFDPAMMTSLSKLAGIYSHVHNVRNHNMTSYAYH